MREILTALLINLRKGEINESCFPSFMTGRRVIAMDSNRFARRLAVGEELCIYFWT